MKQKLHDFALAAISRHIAEHPQAADTLEGIYLGWISWDDAAGDASAPLQLAATQTALQELAQRGVLEVRRVGSGQVWRSHRSTGALD
ncbi:hypothetical protein [Janthinobacterium aquaticum]|uniref:hypothetical protein n=1 Tax=Janthinobacterium sp. FT58W TaxID=2654254 RepID=UPI00126549C4|nr:hypothetical protein [Janthinobacterium sp. FT58W]KAB8042697.1 hypothetical protein GCM43_11520 [Janthinobacterium sp. FT58W]